MIDVYNFYMTCCIAILRSDLIAHARRNWFESNQLFGMIDNNESNTLVKGSIICDFEGPIDCRYPFIIIEFYIHEKSYLLLAGLEPAVSGFGGRRLIH